MNRCALCLINRLVYFTEQGLTVFKGIPPSFGKSAAYAKGLNFGLRFHCVKRSLHASQVDYYRRRISNTFQFPHSEGILHWFERTPDQFWSKALREFGILFKEAMHFFEGTYSRQNRHSLQRMPFLFKKTTVRTVYINGSWLELEPESFRGMLLQPFCWKWIFARFEGHLLHLFQTDLEFLFVGEARSEATLSLKNITFLEKYNWGTQILRDCVEKSEFMSKVNLFSCILVSFLGLVFLITYRIKHKNGPQPMPQAPEHLILPWCWAGSRERKRNVGMEEEEEEEAEGGGGGEE